MIQISRLAVHIFLFGFIGLIAGLTVSLAITFPWIFAVYAVLFLFCAAYIYVGTRWPTPRPK